VFLNLSKKVVWVHHSPPPAQFNNPFDIPHGCLCHYPHRLVSTHERTLVVAKKEELREVSTVGCSALMGDVVAGLGKLPHLTSLDLRKVREKKKEKEKKRKKERKKENEEKKTNFPWMA
jgi:hypothetical protein